MRNVPRIINIIGNLLLTRGKFYSFKIQEIQIYLGSGYEQLACFQFSPVLLHLFDSIKE